MIAVIDYGMGNLASVGNALQRLGLDYEISGDPMCITEAERVILPGVGAFEDAINHLHQRGIDVAVKDLVRRGTPLLGVCLGLQLLFTESEENGLHRGLDIIPGRVIRFADIPYKIPHMGWNSVRYQEQSSIFAGIPQNSFFYFVHSYYVQPKDSEWAVADCDYGINFCCAVERSNLWATQFHPEKSGTIGLQILKNFAEWRGGVL